MSVNEKIVSIGMICRGCGGTITGQKLLRADPDLKNVGGMAKVQTAATAIIAEQPFDNITLSRSELVERTATDIDIQAKIITV